MNFRQTRTPGLPTCEPSFGFPYNYFLMPALQSAYDNFFKNAATSSGVGLQEHFVTTWTRIAGCFADRTSVTVLIVIGM